MFRAIISLISIALTLNAARAHKLNVIYVDPIAGSLDRSCWTGGLDLPCANHQLAEEGAEQFSNSVIALLQRPGNRFDVKEDDDYNDSEGPCPTWMYERNGTCECGSDVLNMVHCNETLREMSILDCNCLTTFDEDDSGDEGGSNSTSTIEVVAAPCLYGCSFNTSEKDTVYHYMPTNVSQLNDAMCGRLNRTGRLCSKCKNGTSPLLYSYHVNCVECTNADLVVNWLKYISVTIIPMTFFFFLVVVFKINAMSPHLNGFIQFSQYYSNNINLRAVLLDKTGTKLLIPIEVLIVPYAVWNLDFFRIFTTNICVDMTTLQTLAMGYVTALYPLLLVICAYVFIELHSRGCRVLVLLWNPFQRCFSRFNRVWDIHSSIIKTFATFLLLCYANLLNVTYDLLVPTRLHNVHGDSVGLYLLYDASYKYFGPAHLPYAILAIIISLTLILPPIVLLVLYPMGCFQRCLSCCNLRSNAVHTFVESFQGYYKDGTEPGTHDCRWFSAMYFIVRIFSFIVYTITMGVVTYIFLAITYVAFGIIIIIVKPYKATYSAYNTTDAVLILILGMWFATISSITEVKVKAVHLVKLAYAVCGIVMLLPMTYIIGFAVYWLYVHHVKEFCKFRNQRVIEREFSDSNLFKDREQEDEPLIKNNNKTIQ